MPKNLPLFDYVLAELQARKGRWTDISKAIAGPVEKDWKAHYSWMSKLTQNGAIKDPGVKKVQTLADWFRTHPREEQAA